MREARPPALVGLRIPSRNHRARRLVVALYTECPWLSSPDLPAAVRWATLSEKFRRLAEHLDSLPVVKQDGEPRKAFAELRGLSSEISKLEASLGIVAAARASLGVQLGHMAERTDLALQLGRLRAERERQGEGEP